MGTIGVFMSIAEKDPHMSARQASLLDGLATNGVNPTNTNIIYAYAFPDLNTQPQYGGQATSLMRQVISSTAPGLKILFASCYPTLQELINNEPNSPTDPTLINPIPIVYGGLFHDDETVGNPNQNFGPNIGGVYSHTLKNLCDKWVSLLQDAVSPLKAIAVTYDKTHGISAQNYVDHIYNATGKTIQPTKIYMTQGEMVQADIDYQLAAFLTGGIDNTNSGLIVPTAALTANRRKLIIQSANQRGLKAIYPHRMYVECMPAGYRSYGAKLLDQYKEAGRMISQAIKDGSFTPTFKALNTFETCP